ncbi:carboxymuconolactone decarboxylase family protein [Sediminispirochaeta bajacaliforniensis]|uniref:carboxymuconolactone decarboxylase family protein n=1 Tax=Sediminispirochaeta bajacaliforniensis TaxID=148 RepID=UPI00035D8854|nr:carboxymuconolactone decarboxylase family protein [Sediminispirochaeta bajacaliforniensis]
MKQMKAESHKRLFRHRYGISELFSSSIKLYPTVFYLIRNKKAQIISNDLRKRPMLAVTEVNGCAICSYAHTKMALEQGMSKQEIHAMLSAGNEFVSESESKTIFCAQHYADSLGKPNFEASQVLLRSYGKKKSTMILSAITVMMYSNICGLPLSAFISRLRGKKYANSTLVYEIVMLLSIIPISLIAAIPALINPVLKRRMQQTR